MDEHRDRSLFLAPPEPTPEPERPVEPPAGRTAPLAEVEGGRRRRLQVVVVVALLVAGVLANRSNTDRAEDAAAREEQRAGSLEIERPAMIPPSLRTTDALGPLLPQLTGTTLVLAAGTQVVVLHLDTGTTRSVQVADLEVRSSYPWGRQLLAVGDAFVVRSQPPRAKIVPRADGSPVADLDAGSGGGLHPSTEEGRFWVEERRGEGLLEEVDLSGEVHRTVPLPVGTESVVWDGAGFVQTRSGTAVAVSPDGGAPTEVAEGLAVAADASTVALLRCEGADQVCALDLLDRATGTIRTVPPSRGAVGFSAGPSAAAPVVLSPDGRWLLIESASPPAGVPPAPVEPGLAIIDVAAGTVRDVEPGSEVGPSVGAFSEDGSWLFLARTTGSVAARLSGVRLVDGARFEIEPEVSVRASFGLALGAFPSTPADLGAGGG